MAKIFALAVFLIVFLIVYLGMNYYIFARVAGLLGLAKNVYFYSGLFAVSLSFIFATILERLSHHILIRYFYYLSSLISGLMFIAFFILLIFELINLLVKINPRIAGLAIIGIVLALTIIAMVNASFIKVRTIEVLADIPQEKTIIQLSDIHVGPIIGKKYLADVAAKVNMQQPDIVVITGDLFDGDIDGVNADILSPLEDIEAPVFFVTGNHESYAGIVKIDEIIAKTSFRYLKDESEIFDDIQLVGLSYSGSKDAVKEKLQNIDIDDSKYSVLLFHMPQGLEDASAKGINLMLSGHTHKGQVFPFILFVRMAFPRIYGLYEHDGTYQYISSGTGTWGPRMRLGSNSEIVKIVFKPKK